MTRGQGHGHGSVHLADLESGEMGQRLNTASAHTLHNIEHRWLVTPLQKPTNYALTSTYCIFYRLFLEKA